jgi:TolB-like protein
VIVEPHDIFGDGVNIAARLESVAEPGGITISSSAYDQVRGKVGVEFADLGEQNLKNISRPVRAYAVTQDGLGPAKKGGSPMPNPSSAPRLSIVVLPFSNIGGEPEQDYFVDGVTESLTTDLSRINGSFVIGRHTAFTLKGKAVDLKQIGRELNTRYVLEGSVQRGGNRLRVNVQLTDAETGNHLWAERFDKPVVDLFDMQDEIVSRLANALNTQLVEAEARRAERTLHPDAMDLYFQGRACLYKGLTRARLGQARGFFERALALDPGNIEALVGTAVVDFNRGANFFTDDRAAPFATAEASLIKALSAAPQHAQAHISLGAVHIYTARAAQGIAECEQALALDRNLAQAHAFIGMAKNFLGRSEETEADIKEALRLSPRDIFANRWMMFAGAAKLWHGADAEAVGWLRRSIDANRNFPLAHFHLATALALQGRLDEARAAAKAGLTLDPGFTIRRYRANALSDNPNYLAGRERSYQGMHIAGVPE